MRTWAILLGGLLVWTIHFFGLYLIAEFAPSAALAIALTIPCLAADIWLLMRARAPAQDRFGAWRRSVATGGAMLSLIALCWQALPAIVQ